MKVSDSKIWFYFLQSWTKILRFAEEVQALTQKAKLTTSEDVIQ